MEDLGGVQCEENKAFSEKKFSRQYKSKEQLQGLEDFYTEHKYPTEALKAELAIKLNLTEKQVSGWFCHRRLKDKRALKAESQTPGKQDFSSGIIQDRGSGLKQDSCSSTKQAEYKRADTREVDSQRYRNENYQHRTVGNGTEMDDTSSESNSAPQENFYPQKRSQLAVESETTEYRAPNGFIQRSRGRTGPSGYLKIKGHTENAAITAVKRQLGRHYREDGPSLGIEFDPLPPEAFESPSNTIDDNAYGIPRPTCVGAPDISETFKRPGLNTVGNEVMYESPNDIHLRKSVPDNFAFRRPKDKLLFPNHSRGFPDQKPSYGRVVRDPKNRFLPDYDDVNPKAVRQREQFPSRPATFVARRNDPMYNDDIMSSNRAGKDEELSFGRRLTSEHQNSTNLKMRPTNDLRATKRGRVESREEDYPVRSSSQDPALGSKQRKGPTEAPSSFSEDETAETSSSMG